MLTKHFWKTLLLFGLMVGIALLGVLWVTYFDEKPETVSSERMFAE